MAQGNAFESNFEYEDSQPCIQNLMCCAADVLEGKGAVQVSITVTELLKFHSQRITSPTKSPVNAKSNVSSSLPPTTLPA